MKKEVKERLIEEAAKVLVSLTPETRAATKRQVAERAAKVITPDRGAREELVKEVLLGLNGIWSSITERADDLMSVKKGLYTFDGQKHRYKTARLTVGDGLNTAGGEMMFFAVSDRGRFVKDLDGNEYWSSPISGRARTDNIMRKTLDRTTRQSEMQAKKPNAKLVDKIEYANKRLAKKIMDHGDRVLHLFNEMQAGRADDVDVLEAALPLSEISPEYVQEIYDILESA